MRFADFISEASKLARPVAPSEECSAATVASSIISGLGDIYTGVCMDFECGITLQVNSCSSFLRS
jgi:hypothetical protein